ncbi:hypothetical protein BJ742DRAFT_427376 [Cladochytrium replicatum]|nr:hypothetical protein BJ742DRAFT_427376 [Cladochytrium replicatum]
MPKLPPSLFVLDDVPAVSRALDDFVSKLSAQSIADHGFFAVALSGGSLPQTFAASLKSNKSVDFSKWYVFYADERCVPHESEDSNHGLVDKVFLQHVPVPPGRVFPIHPALVANPPPPGS